MPSRDVACYGDPGGEHGGSAVVDVASETSSLSIGDGVRGIVSIVALSFGPSARRCQPRRWPSRVCGLEPVPNTSGFWRSSSTMPVKAAVTSSCLSTSLMRRLRCALVHVLGSVDRWRMYSTTVLVISRTSRFSSIRAIQDDSEMSDILC